MTVESENAKEEIRDIVDKCVRCGFCKSLCPVFKAICEEEISPRGKTILLQDEVYDKIIYECTLCKACEQKCPLGLKLCEAFKKARKVLCEEGKETKDNREMIKNVQEFGNPFGKDAGKNKKMYCC